MRTDFNQTRLMRFFGWLVHAHPNFWIDVGKLETQLLKGRLARRAVDAPIYITGLGARWHDSAAEHIGVSPAPYLVQILRLLRRIYALLWPTISSVPSDWARRANRSEHMPTA